MDNRQGGKFLCLICVFLSRPSSSSPALGAISNVDYSTHDSQAPRKLSARANNTHPAAATNSTSLPAMKRSRSPTLHSSDEATEGNMYASEDAER